MEENNNGCGLVLFGLVGILTIVFVVLKLCKVIVWSWIWILSPLWIWIILMVLIIILVTVVNLWIKVR